MSRIVIVNVPGERYPRVIVRRPWIVRMWHNLAGFFWMTGRRVRNLWRRFLRWRRQRCEECYHCALVFPTASMTLYFTSDGESHPICSRCRGTDSLIALAAARARSRHGQEGRL